MKILEVIGGLDRGGAETLLINILENIKKDNYKFDLLVYEKKKFDYYDKVIELGCNIIFIESPNEIGMIKFIKELKKTIKKNKYDVVHAHTLFNCGPVMLASYLAGVKTRISHSHNTKILEENPTLKKRIYFKISKILINLFSTKCLACGVDAGNFLFYRFKKFQVIKNGINIDKYKYNKKYNDKLRKKYNIDEKAIIFGNIGRLNFQKNQLFLLDIFNEIHKKNKNSYLFILGDGELKSRLLTKVKKFKIQNHVIFTGNIENANEYYSLFNCFLFPSVFEGLPYTLIEAQANGLPIMASDQISKEVDISHSIKFIGIDEKNVDNWVDYANDAVFKERLNNDSFIINEGYSIIDTVKNIENIYEGKS